MTVRRHLGWALAVVLLAAMPAQASAKKVGNERQLRAAWGDARQTTIDLSANITLRGCQTGDPIRDSWRPMTLDGHGHTITQRCFMKRLLRQDGTGRVILRRVTLTRGGTHGTGGAVTTRGDIEVIDSQVFRNLAEKAGGGIYSARRATIIRSVITGNLANHDGGGVYALGGVRVSDSVVGSNVVDGSGGAIGSTGDILVVRSHVDGNTTDGDGGAIYADRAGSVTVIDSTVDGSTAEGPGGAIFALDGDVAVIGSTANGNRADDRGGAISGEGYVTIINSTIARNAAVAHVGGGVWARGDLYMENSTVSNNYAEGEGGGVLAAGEVTLAHATIADNVAPVAANVGAGAHLQTFASVIGPANTDPFGGQVQPTDVICDTPAATSRGFNVVTDGSCRLHGKGDIITHGTTLLGPLAQNGGLGETRLPLPGSPAIDAVAAYECAAAPFARVLAARHLGRYLPRKLAQRDQRGVTRAPGKACDAGAVESGGTGRRTRLTGGNPYGIPLAERTPPTVPG